MSVLNQEMAARYKNDFLKEIEEQAEMGEWVKMCMQCGLCSGSCPKHFQAGWDHPPQEIFMMIRAGKRDEVLESKSMWMCTSCYNCYVGCPRKIPVTHVMHGIAEYAYRIGRSPKFQPTQHLSKTFWDNCTKTGRVNELNLTQRLYFKDGLITGIKKLIQMQAIGLGLLRAKRMNLLEAFGAGHKCKDSKGIHAMLAKAKELETQAQGSQRVVGYSAWTRRRVQRRRHVHRDLVAHASVSTGQCDRILGGSIMINLHIDYSGKSLDFNTASAMALARARANKMRQPAIVSWRQHRTHVFSPGFEGADEESWWSKYGEGNGGQVDIRVGDDFEFIVIESGGYETVRNLPLRNLKDAVGIEYVCLSPMLDDSGKPRKDACSPLDDWMADQY